ncbi:MAG: hypothetical protein PHV77_03400 [Candidatus Omnitrophica bacterium]|nr:hypothetical protein [Candidatus Omnitrophota bacterium]
MVYKVFIFFIVIMLVSGCQYPFELKPDSEIRQEVLEFDPDFEQALQKRAKLDEEIALLRSKQQLNASQIETKILSLKDELRSSKRDISSQILSLNAQLDPQRSEIKRSIMELSTELRLKQSSFSAVRKMILDLNRLNGKDSVQDQPSGDSSRLREKISAHQEQADTLMRDISVLREKIRLLRFKLKLLH